VRTAPPYAVVAGALVAALFVARATEPLITSGAIGENRSEGLWRAGRSQIDAWYTLPASERVGPRGAATLRIAAGLFLAERAAAPGSAWPTSELGSVYACREIAARSRRTVDLGTLERGPWATVGDDGRIAIGLTRAAIDRDPSSYEFRDKLVLLLERNGLHEDALRAMDEAARVLPDFNAHPDFAFESLPRDLVEMFWRTARGLGPADAPLLPRDRYLLSLGQLGRRLGHLDEADHDLRTALNASRTRLGRAEAAFHLGLVLVDRGRLDEAEAMLVIAAGEPLFEPGVAGTRARIAVMGERWMEALEDLRELRRFQPRELGVLLEFARVAQKTESWDQAEESLRWAILVHPEDPVPHGALVQMFLAKGEKESAQRALNEYVRSFGRTDEATRMEQALTEPLDPARR
jgi:tetratricopeptide (TPR) repeat protein